MMKKWVFALCGVALVTATPLTASAATVEDQAVVVETKTEKVTWKPMSDNAAAKTDEVAITEVAITPDKPATTKKTTKKKAAKKKKRRRKNRQRKNNPFS
ncbi:hypothetical protein [Kurthia sp. Dielmo]|uniref:hypothetical protein n=1 Tax=Kurthia sp. Dielmo TaxID=1033738 RepID=UPI00111EC9BA|nr:hypothetical protein [Kurthia sp. Dielmo]